MLLPVDFYFLYGANGIIASFISIYFFRKYVKDNVQGMKMLAYFFAFVSFYFLFFTFSIFIYKSSQEMASIGFIIARLMIFPALYYAFRAPVFSDEIIIEYRKIILYLLYVVSIISFLSQTIFFSIPTISGSGVVIRGIDPYSGFIIGGTSIFFGILWVILLAKNIKTDVEKLTDKSIYIKTIFIAIGGLILGIGDFVFITSQTEAQSIMGTFIGSFGYSFLLLYILISFIHSRSANKKQNLE